MPFTLSEVIPWGRSYAEYVSMFSLSAADLRKKILGCGDGPASFNSILTSHGGSVVSVDPLYDFSAPLIRKKIEETYKTVLAQTRKNRNEFVWDSIASPEELGRIRMSAMEVFLEDFETGKAAGRYKAGRLPRLHFTERAFDLAVCSHFLFLYSTQLSQEFHLASITELCRVADEVRIFPLLELGGHRSRHLETIMAKLENEQYHVVIEKVPYQFQKGGNEMMMVTRT